jgi:hypothetical protein
MKSETKFSNEIQTSFKGFWSFLFTITSTALLWDLYFFKLTQPLTVSTVPLLYTVKEKGGKSDRKPYPLSYGLRNSYRNLKSENSQDYAQKSQWRKMYVHEFGCFCTVQCTAQYLRKRALQRKGGFIKDEYWDGIHNRTLSLGFLGIILRVLRLEVSTLGFGLSTRCYSWTSLSFLYWLIVVYGFLKP